MRFHVPNSELDEYHDEKKNAAEGEKASGEESEDEMTAAKHFQNKVNTKANIG
jgi:hypothetical protein